MNYPLELRFKVWAIGNQVSVTERDGNLVFFVKQKAFKLKESVTVFADAEQTRPLYTINADRVLDISATYSFSDSMGAALGSVKRHGRKSFWRAHYEISDGTYGGMIIREDNPWIKLVDGLLGEIPIVGIFSGYFLHPRYTVTRASDGMQVMSLEKKPAFLQGRFAITKEVALSESEEIRVLLAILMLVLLERSRG